MHSCAHNMNRPPISIESGIAHELVVQRGLNRFPYSKAVVGFEDLFPAVPRDKAGGQLVEFSAMAPEATPDAMKHVTQADREMDLGFVMRWLLRRSCFRSPASLGRCQARAETILG